MGDYCSDLVDFWVYLGDFGGGMVFIGCVVGKVFVWFWFLDCFGGVDSVGVVW